MLSRMDLKTPVGIQEVLDLLDSISAGSSRPWPVVWFLSQRRGRTVN